MPFQARIRSAFARGVWYSVTREARGSRVPLHRRSYGKYSGVKRGTSDRPRLASQRETTPKRSAEGRWQHADLRDPSGEDHADKRSAETMGELLTVFFTARKIPERASGRQARTALRRNVHVCPHRERDQSLVRRLFLYHLSELSGQICAALK